MGTAGIARLRATWLTLVFLGAPTPSLAVGIVNGSMNHTGGTNYLYFNGYIAPGWTQDNSGTNPDVYTTSPDIFDPAMTAFSMAWVPSSDGGMFAHCVAWLDGENQEGIYQTLTGLVVGAEYQISFEQSITDTNFTDSGIPGQWQVRFGSTTQYSDVMLAPDPGVAYGWDLQTLSFVATASTQDLSFLAHSADPSTPVYIGLDGVSIRATSVPEPSTAALWALAASVLWRRLKSCPAESGSPRRGAGAPGSASGRRRARR